MAMLLPDLVKFCNAAPFSRVFILGDVLQHHVDVDIEAAEGADELLVPLHDDPDLGADAPVDQL